MAIKKFSDGTPAPAIAVKAQDGTPAPAIKPQDGTPAPALKQQEDQILAMTPEQEIAANPTATQTGPYLAEKARLSAQEDFNKVNAPRPATATGRTWIAQGLAKKRLDEENANVAAWDRRMAIPIRSYPSLAKAMALEPTLTEADVRRVVNLASAWTTAEAIEAQETPQGRMNILLSLPPMQRFVVSDILISRANAQEDSRKRARRDVRLAEEEKATWGPAKQLVAGFDRGLVELGTGFMRTVNNIYEGTQQALATSADAYFENKRENGPFSTFTPSLTGDANLVTDLFTRWDEHELGNYEDSVIAQARETYGSIPVDLIIEIKQAANEGDPNPIMTVSQRHLNDPERAEYISLLTKRVIDDPEMERRQRELIILEEKIDSAAINDPGAIITTHDWFNGEPIDIENSWRESMARVGLSKAFNVTAALVLDPTIALSKGVRIAKGVRYGLEQIASTAGAQSVQDALTMPEVYRYVNRMTDDVSKYISMRSAGEDTAKFGRMLDERYKAYFDPSVIADMVKANVTTPEAFIAYVQNTNRMAQIARGQVAGMQEVGILTKNQAGKQIADIEGNTVFGRMYGQQGARRSKPLLPGSSITANTTRIPEVSRTVSNFVQQIGPKKSRQQAVSRLFGEANDDTKSFAMLMNENADTLGRNARLFADDSGVAGNVAAAWDKTTRSFSTTPGTAAIYTKDARDTGIFYKYARMHLPKHQAQLLADEWRNGTQAERVLMWIGTVRSSTYARGFEDISDMVLRLPDGTVTNVGDYTKTLNVGTRQDVLFSPQSIEVFNGESFVDLNTYMGLSSSAGDNVGAIGNDVIRRSPSDFGGIQHPLHLWQTSDYLAVPNMNELQRITKRNALINAVRRKADGANYATEVVNWWSLLNLAGPRYATRNAFEDIGLYALTGGYLMDFVKGAASAKGIREARGMKPGILSRIRRKAGGEAKPGDPGYSVWEHVFKPQLNKQEVAQARAAAEDGDLVALRQLALKATVRLEAGRLLSVDEERYLVDFLSSHAAFAKLDEVSQTTYYAAAGIQPGIDVSTTPVRGMVGTDEVRVYPRGQYTNIALSGSAGTSGLDAGRFVYWHRNIRNTILADGRIGQIAMQNLDNPDQATRLIAKELSDPSSAEYKQRLAAFFDVRVNVSDDEFARRYVQDVYNTFSRQDGSFNSKLWQKFVMENADGTRTVRFGTKINGKWEAPVSVDDLRKMNIEDMPQYILGRETSPIAVSVKMGIDDKLWTMMGNVVSRISKEPIFMANYFRARKQLLPYEERLIAEVGPDLARETVTRHALDRATTVSLSYTDNPANQTILAWRLRNWARYYRATEDFYRRVYRMGKFEPIGFYKAALTLNALEDQGFVYNDDYGDKYFIYPGDGLVNTIIGSAIAKLGGNDLLVGSAPLIFGGKVKMLAPSLDPKAAIPTLGGPLSAISMKFIFSAFPQLRAIEKYTLGEYSVDKTVIETSFAAPMVRFLAALGTDERQSVFASAYMSAAKVLTAAGKMPELSEGLEDEGNQALATVASNIIWTKFAAGFIYQATPQIMENDVTTFAREYGIPSMSGDYKDRVQKYREAGETDPYGMALQEGISIFGIDYTAYNVSEYQSGDELKSLPELNYVDDLLGFVENNDKLVKEYPASAYFLAPQSAGELSVPALNYYKDKELRVPKSYADYAKELLYAKGKYYYYDIMRVYRDSVASADGPGAEADAKNKKNLALTELFSDLPGLQERVKGDISLADWEKEAINRNNPDSVRRMVDDYYDGKFGPVPNSVKYIAEAMNTYDYFTTEKNKISGSSEPERLAKNSYETALLRSLQSIAEDDPNAEMFIRKVLYVLLDADSEGNPK